MTVNEGHEVTVTVLGCFLHRTTYITVNIVKNMRILNVRDLQNWLSGHYAFKAGRALVSLILIIMLVNLYPLNNLLLEQFLHCGLSYMSKTLVPCGQGTYRLLLK